ncbi:hypothetical protein [Ramlibacter sp. PS4R-6]|uniref:hypothetical protein n=1 Tax=Ramlibacter sp. PS4R-6 TaxID=3133438 RepID=UPI0030AD51CF
MNKPLDLSIFLSKMRARLLDNKYLGPKVRPGSAGRLHLDDVRVRSAGDFAWAPGGRRRVLRISGFFLPLLFAFPANAGEAGLSQRCDVLMRSDQCVDVTGTWMYLRRKDALNMLEIKPSAPDKFTFKVDAGYGGSTTHLEGEFTLKHGLGLHADGRCSMVFVPLSPQRLKVVGFGECEEGHGARIDGTYSKTPREQGR